MDDTSVVQLLKEAPVGETTTVNIVLDELPVQVVWKKIDRTRDESLAQQGFDLDPEDEDYKEAVWYTVKVKVTFHHVLNEIHQTTAEAAWSSYEKMLKKVWNVDGFLVDRAKAALKDALRRNTDLLLGYDAPTCCVCYGPVSEDDYPKDPRKFEKCTNCHGIQHTCFKCTRLWQMTCTKNRTPLTCPACREPTSMRRV